MCAALSHLFYSEWKVHIDRGSFITIFCEAVWYEGMLRNISSALHVQEQLPLPMEALESCLLGKPLLV